MAYLDHNATSPLRPEARRAMEHACQSQANASSMHHHGRAARRLIDAARESVARLVSARPDHVIFTSGGTEANALALTGAFDGALDEGRPIERLLVSAIEHDSILQTATGLGRRHASLEIVRLPVTEDGVVDLCSLERHLIGRRTLVAIMAANNETGVIQPVAEAQELVRRAGGLFLVDAVQACAKMECSFPGLGADYLTLSAHKLGGPQGAGALVLKEGAPFAPQLFGGGQEQFRRAGTENVPGIAGFGAAADAARNDDMSRLERLRDLFESGLQARFGNAIIFGINARRLANTSNFAIPEISAETGVISLDLDGVMVSSGSACSSGKVKPSHVLAAMNVPSHVSQGAMRISLGWNSTEADVNAALNSLERLTSRVAARKAA